jgi:hypothetical protein
MSERSRDKHTEILPSRHGRRILPAHVLEQPCRDQGDPLASRQASFELGDAPPQMGNHPPRVTHFPQSFGGESKAQVLQQLDRAPLLRRRAVVELRTVDLAREVKQYADFVWRQAMSSDLVNTTTDKSQDGLLIRCAD